MVPELVEDGLAHPLGEVVPIPEANVRVLSGGEEIEGWKVVDRGDQVGLRRQVGARQDLADQLAEAALAVDLGTRLGPLLFHVQQPRLRGGRHASPSRLTTSP